VQLVVDRDSAHGRLETQAPEIALTALEGARTPTPHKCLKSLQFMGRLSHIEHDDIEAGFFEGLVCLCFAVFDAPIVHPLF
jgi:hypothetical protein